MRTLITVSTEDGQWAPARAIELVATMDSPTGMGITNSHSVSWTLRGRTKITRAAIAVSTGNWMVIDFPKPVSVRRNQDAILAAGAIMITIELPTLSTKQIEQQGVLPMGKGELPERVE